MATSGKGLAEPRAPHTTAASLRAAADKRRRLGLQEPAGPRLTALSPRVGKGGRGTGHCLRQFQKSHHSRAQTATKVAPRAGSSPLQTPAFLHKVPNACVLRMGVVHPPRQTPRPGRGLHTCGRPFIPTHLGHPPAQTGRCGWLCVGVSGISDQEI